MPSYTQRQTKKGTVVDVRFRIIDEKGFEVQKRLCGYPNKRIAQQAYLKFMQNYTPPTFKQKENGMYYYEDLLPLYKKKMQAELAVSSYYDLNWILDKFITPSFNNKFIPALTKADFSIWQTNLWAMKNDKTGEFFSQKYLTKIRSTLMTFLNWCEETFDIPNLYKTIKKPKRKELRKEMQIWELDEFLRFQNSIDDIMWKTFFMLLFYSGCRVGEILALSDNDLIKDNGQYNLIIDKGLTRKTSNTEDKYLITAPKTQTSNRKIFLPDIMSTQIEEFLKYKHDNKISNTFLFYGDSPLRQRTYQRYFEKYTNEAGLKKIRIHDLRHSHASMMIHLNVPITVISKRLGHSSVKMTLEKYSHCYSNGDSEAITIINEAIKSIS